MKSVQIKQFELPTINFPSEYSDMIKLIEQNHACIEKSTQNFNKTQSQFMDNLLTISHPTPLRNIRQILAEINRIQDALKEAFFNNSKKEIQIKIKERELQKLEKSSLEHELQKIEILELKVQIDSSRGYIEGAIRALVNYTEQYNSILLSIGKTEFTEKDFEEEEERYHIMKSFDQATIAARSRNGVVDEGNLMYFTQIGINCGVAQNYISKYLLLEKEIIDSNNIPSSDFYFNFLKDMATIFKDCSKNMAKQKGMTGEISRIATLK